MLRFVLFFSGVTGLCVFVFWFGISLCCGLCKGRGLTGLLLFFDAEALSLCDVMVLGVCTLSFCKEAGFNPPFRGMR